MFDKCIELEPPYTLFAPVEYIPKKEKSSWLGKLFSNNSNQDIQSFEYPDVVANYLTETTELFCLEIIFRAFQDLKEHKVLYLLNQDKKNNWKICKRLVNFFLNIKKNKINGK